MTHRLQLLCFCLLLALPSVAQYAVKGIVTDAQSGQALPFVNIVWNDSRHGTTSDIDGRFELKSNQPFEKILFSYVGYEIKTILNPGADPLRVGMARKSLTLQEVAVIAGENPAHRIIRAAVDRRDHNDPEKLSSFRYTAYNKFVVTVDTNDVLLDTIPYRRIKTAAGVDSVVVDSSRIRTSDYFRKRDLFLTESVSQRSFRAPDLSQERVLALRTSGLKSPEFLLLSSQMQSFSFYKDYIEILQTRYLNPLSPGSTSRYFFQIEDTSYQAPDTVFVISFRPKTGKNFKGMKGLLYINTNGYALQNVIASPADSLESMQISIRQLYKQVNGHKWFPEQLHTDIILGGIVLNGMQPVALGRSYLRDIELEPALSRKEIGTNGVEVANGAYQTPPAFWQTYRIEGSEGRDQETYRYLDSLSSEHQLEQRLKYAMALATGRLALGPVDLRLKEMLAANRYEGLRLGLSLATNDKVSRWFSVGGYLAWGFQDRQGKYGGNADFYLDTRKNWRISVAHRNDLEESGGYRFFNADAALFSQHSEVLWPLFRQYFDRNLQENEFRLQFLNQRYLSGTIGLRTVNKEQTPWYRYRYLPDETVADMLPPDQLAALPANRFQYTELRFQLRYAFRERYVKLSNQQHSLGTSYPVVSVNYSRGLKILSGDYDFHRMELRIEKTFVIRNAGSSNLQLNAGMAIGNDLPLNLLYFTRGIGSDKVVYAQHSFQTIDANDFVNDRFITLHWRHSFESLLFRTAKQAPVFALENRLIFGTLRHPGRHVMTAPVNVFIRSLERGYFESGLTLSRIKIARQMWGFGVFYGYGPNQKPALKDNLAVKLIFGI